MIKITGITLIGDMAVNCYIVTDIKTGKTAVIDPGYYTSLLDKTLREIGLENIEYILLTHGHFDHISGVNALLKETNGSAKVVIHTDEEKILRDPMKNLSAMFTNTPITNVKPDIFVKDGQMITLGESDIKVMHTPGHTPGSVCYIYGKSIFSGDTLFHRSAGRTDFPCGSSEQLMASLKRLAALEGDYDVYPGHNDTTTMNEERRYNPFIND